MNKLLIVFFIISIVPSHARAQTVPQKSVCDELCQVQNEIKKLERNRTLWQGAIDEFTTEKTLNEDGTKRKMDALELKHVQNMKDKLSDVNKKLKADQSRLLKLQPVK